MNSAKKKNKSPIPRSMPKVDADPLSKCAFNYAQAAVDPWGVEDPPCVPDEINLPSFKTAVRARGTFTTGGSLAFAALYPYNAIKSDYSIVINTLSNYTENLIQYQAGTVNVFSDSPFTAASFVVPSNGPAATGRIVGAGLRVRYIGSELNRGGQYILYRAQANSLIRAGTSVTQLLSDRNTVTAPVDREWHSVVWKPATMNDIAYANVGEPGSTTIVSYTSPSMGIFVSGTLPTGSVFEYDAVEWWEITGPNLSNLTPSHTDVTGFAAVQSARGTINQAGSITDTVSSFMGSVYKGLTMMSGVVSPAAPYVMEFAKQAAMKTLQNSGNGLGQTLSIGHW